MASLPDAIQSVVDNAFILSAFSYWYSFPRLVNDL